MRAKPTFLEKRKLRRHPSAIGSFVNDFRNDQDNELDPELAEILRTQRMRQADEAHLPALGDVRATLERLLGMDDAQRSEALKSVDALTEGELTRGAYLWHKERSPNGPLPTNFDQVASQPGNVQKQMIELALGNLNSIKHNCDGRRASQRRDVQFVRELISYWGLRHGRATVSLNHERPSPFLRFVHECFLRVKHPVSRDALRRTIRAARREPSQTAKNAR